MKCPNCGNETSFQAKKCQNCNCDVTDYKKLVGRSNGLYNDALYKAKIRDLSGAIVSLKSSLQLNKYNTNARNLLGLVYYEMGDTVRALGEWVLSKNFQEEDNNADYYMKLLQNNPSKLNHVNSVIKKYNYGLAQAKSGNYDVALLQLKKVVSAQPNFVAAQQLLALLYMQQGDNEKAAKCLRKAQKIDINNTTTLRYLAELGLNPSAVRVDREIAKRNNTKNKQLERAEDPKFSAPEPVLRDGKIDKWSFLHLLIGVAIGLLTVVFLVLPTRESAIASRYNDDAKEMAEVQTELSSQIQTLENDKEKKQEQIDSLKEELQTMKEEALDEAAYNRFLKAVILYIDGEEQEAAEKLIDIDVTKFDSSVAEDLYNTVTKDIFPSMSEDKCKEGYQSYISRNYSSAIDTLKLALKYNKENDQAMYYLGLTYQASGEDDKAVKYYKKVVEGYVTSRYYADSTRRLQELTEE